MKWGHPCDIFGEVQFELTGGYQFADSFLIANDEPFIYAQAGRLTGAWQWRFEDGTIGTTHVNGATANRITPEGATLLGTMKINMFEIDGSPPESQLLFLAYESTKFYAEGSKVTITVEGRFVGGKGKYAGASGNLEVTSVNGFIGQGTGRLVF